MKAVLFALALVGSCAIAVQAQAPSAGPEECVGQTVFDVALANGLTTFVEAMTLDSLESSLDNSTGYPLTYTVLAPTNDAISEGLANLGIDLETVFHTGRLDPVLQYHFIITPYTESQLESTKVVGTNFRNTTLTFGPDGYVQAYGSNATIVTPNIKACQSYIQIIDNLLIPNFNAPAPGASGAASS